MFDEMDEDPMSPSFILICLAGPLAHHRETGEAIEAQGGADLADARDQIRVLGLNEAACFRRAEKFVTNHWDRIEGLAAELFHRRTVSAGELQTLLGRSCT